MSIEIYNELDPVFEILGLLTIAHGGDWKTETIKAMDDYGIDGQAFENRGEVCGDFFEVQGRDAFRGLLFPELFAGVILNGPYHGG